MPDELLGLSEVAELLGVTKRTALNYTAREEFPEPVAELAMGPVWKKRDFGITGEPKGEVAHAGKALSFVIQKHAATRLHWDFRLEADGVLKSWAVTKEPTLDIIGPTGQPVACHFPESGPLR